MNRKSGPDYSARVASSFDVAFRRVVFAKSTYQHLDFKYNVASSLLEFVASLGSNDFN